MAGALGFLLLGLLLEHATTVAADERLLRLMRTGEALADPLGPGWLEESVRDITALGSVTVLFLLVGGVCGYLAVRRQYRDLRFLLIVVIGAGILNFVLKETFGRPRPTIVDPLVVVTSKSFPSGHAMLSTVVYLTMGTLLARLAKHWRSRLLILGLALILPLLVGLSRIYLGVHYPTDVLGGWIVGGIWTAACLLLDRVLQSRAAKKVINAVRDEASA
jgi:undecaprenyl-diphosphatase